MSNSKMLIDATHPEETRVVVVRGGRVEEFDYESAARKLLRGNIYLAKITRVEPSLQAAFVDYGGNRHGFLAFGEIHPDYYQIPVADRQLLIDEEAKAEAEEEAEADAHAEALSASAPEGEATGQESDGGPSQEWQGEVAPSEPTRRQNSRPRRRGRGAARAQSAGGADEQISEDAEPRHSANGETGEHDATARAGGSDSDDGESGGLLEIDTGAGNGEQDAVEEVATEQDALEEVPARPRRRARSYKIQEVIKRRQVVLVQVVKEERGNKGAALTTYLSLAGRYTVLMPNTARGGGISRKITNPPDRKRLKAIANELEVPEGMGLIIRTAGAARTKQEIKRDFEYLLRLWESVRDLTLESTAPSLVYEEGNLIKRSIRDHFTKDVDEVVVAGEHAYNEAHDFMRMLMPSHAKNVINYLDAEPLFARHQVERQLNAMFSPFVTLRSGGYLVINQTEALVAIDINSGKSTREFSIEETALNTNLEAADEIARQLKLRDLAGLIVVDFIDMEEKRNNRAVERRIKDALRIDRARIQIGHISHFGLLEMSRQRLRTGVLEGSTSQCPHCQGTGIVRSTESVSLAVLRGIEDTLMGNPRGGLIASTTAPVAIYILNNKRAFINEMEQRYEIQIIIQASDKLQGANFNIERTAATAPVQRRPERQVVSMDWGFEGEAEGGVEDNAPEAEIEEVGEAAGEDAEAEADDFAGGEHSERGNGRRGKRRRRRGQRGDRPEGGSEHRPHHQQQYQQVAGDRDADPMAEESVSSRQPAVASYAAQAAAIAGGEDAPDVIAQRQDHVEAGEGDDAGDRSGRRGRRRGRRGGRRGRDRDQPRHADAGAVGNGSDISDLPAHDAAPLHRDAPHVAGQGPQPDLPPDLPMGFAGGDERPARRRDNWRDRRNGNNDNRRRDHHRQDGDAEAAAPAALVAASIAAAMAAPAETHAVAAPASPPAPPPAPLPEPAASPPAESAPAAVPARSRHTAEMVSVEPKIERVVMRPDRIDDATAEAPPAPSARKGWWQRKFGGEA